jgi:hypothetical protein
MLVVSPVFTSDDVTKVHDFVTFVDDLVPCTLSADACRILLFTSSYSLPGTPENMHLLARQAPFLLAPAAAAILTARQDERVTAEIIDLNHF